MLKMNCQNNDQSTDPWLLSSKSDKSETLVVDSIDENSLKFSDNFEPKLNETKDSVDLTTNSLPDSQQYIRSLERKLDKLKGRTKEMSTKDVMTSLSAKRDAILQQFVESTDSRNEEFDSETHDSSVANNSTLYRHFERLLFPQIQALTEQELQRLLDSDLLDMVNINTNQDIRDQ